MKNLDSSDTGSAKIPNSSAIVTYDPLVSFPTRPLSLASPSPRVTRKAMPPPSSSSSPPSFSASPLPERAPAKPRGRGDGGGKASPSMCSGGPGSWPVGDGGNRPDPRLPGRIQRGGAWRRGGVVAAVSGVGRRRRKPPPRSTPFWPDLAGLTRGGGGRRGSVRASGGEEAVAATVVWPGAGEAERRQAAVEAGRWQRGRCPEAGEDGDGGQRRIRPPSAPPRLYHCDQSILL
uniref:Uncharacterized protein n=1 Tax=Oryza meridionalis TaxID=40149 RepID=A0A0E0EC37_9ORYZ